MEFEGAYAQTSISISLNRMRESGFGPLNPRISRTGSISHFYAAHLSKTQLFAPRVILWPPQGLPGDSLGAPRDPQGSPRDLQGLPRDPPGTSQGDPGPLQDPSGPLWDPSGTPQ